MPDRSRSRRLLGFVVIVALCTAIAVAYVVRARGQASAAQAALASGQTTTAPLAGPGVLVTSQRGEDFGRLAFAPAGSAEPTTKPLACERVHYAAGRGLCLRPSSSLPGTYVATVFGPRLEPGSEIRLSGVASRARVSRDGRLGATTTFVTGHSYADDLASTETLLLDLQAGKALGNLESFTTTRDGVRVDTPDMNFWGVTFPDDSNRFYATLRTAGRTYLVEGDVAARTMRTLRENVECPSLSPDQTRVAFKKLVGEDEWRLTILDLATGTETPLAETRSVDDQVEWLDNEQVLYGIAGQVWRAAADGSGQPSVHLADAASPAVLR